MDAPRIRPWLFVPVLYFMQAIPVTIVQEVSSVFYKDLGIDNLGITRWTSLIALPWALQFLLGPLVELNGRKRDWIFGGQFLIALGLGISALALKMPHAFEITLVLLGSTALISALCNIATDGFYILSLTREQQAAYVGAQTTFYRLGRLFCAGLLVLVVGKLTALPRVEVHTSQNAYLRFLDDKKEVVLSGAKLGVNNSAGGEITDDQGRVLQPPINLPRGTSSWSIRPDGLVLANGLALGKLQVLKSGLGQGALTFIGPSAGQASMVVETGWMVVLLGAALIYLLGYLYARQITPDEPPLPLREWAGGGLAATEAEPPLEPHTDPTDITSAPTLPRKAGTGDIARTLAVILVGLSVYFLCNSLVRLGAHALWSILGHDPAGKWKGWMLPTPNTVLGLDFHLGGVGTEVAQLAISAAVGLFAFGFTRRSLRGTEMGEAFSSFVRQSGFWAIFGFLIFYRFGEAMVGKMSLLFLKDSVVAGGLAVPNDRLGLIKGVAGVIGIVLGGICGGLFVSKIGLRKAFWPMAFLMHLPNLLYLWAALNRPPGMSWTLFGVDFVDQFGYGFGFAGYSIYLMWVAQRGRFQTAHYAIGTGLGAMLIAIAGVLSGVIQSNFGYPWFFGSVIFFTLPGMAMLAFIPLDEPRPANA